MNKGLENVDIYIVKLCKKSYKIEKKQLLVKKKIRCTCKIAVE